MRSSCSRPAWEWVGRNSKVLAGGRELKARGHEVFIVSLTALGPMGEEAQGLGIPTESLEMPRAFLTLAAFSG